MNFFTAGFGTPISYVRKTAYHLAALVTCLYLRHYLIKTKHMPNIGVAGAQVAYDILKVRFANQGGRPPQDIANNV